ncbi:MAG: glutamate racemase [Lachnospiraceae bacterium]|nr:glutamate racemase [Lachnospiraceae bacterium]
METGEDFIGVFDSGLGGISVLASLTKKLPREDFLFYGDSANAPYGEKSEEQVRSLSVDLADRLIQRGAKAVVIACNTATSAAAQTIRERYPEVPIVGVEPAVKPAALNLAHKKVLVMATSMTLARDKYKELAQRFEASASLLPLACPDLAARIEEGNLEGADLYRMLEKLLAPYIGKVDGVVLGCTHYPFVKKQIASILGELPFFDGANGTANELSRRLGAAGLLTQRTGPGRVIFDSSKKLPAELALYEEFYQKALFL